MAYYPNKPKGICSERLSNILVPCSRIYRIEDLLVYLFWIVIGIAKEYIIYNIIA